MDQGTPTRRPQPNSPSEDTVGSLQSARTGDFAPDHIIRGTGGTETSQAVASISQAPETLPQYSPPSLSTTLVPESSEPHCLSSRHIPSVVGANDLARSQPSPSSEQEGMLSEQASVHQQRQLAEAQEALDESSHPVAEGFWSRLSNSNSDIPGFHDTSPDASAEMSIYQLAPRRNRSSRYSSVTTISRPSQSHSLVDPFQASRPRSVHDQRAEQPEASEEEPEKPSLSLRTSFTASPKSTLAAPRSQPTSVRGTLYGQILTSNADPESAQSTLSDLGMTALTANASHTDDTGSD